MVSCKMCSHQHSGSLKMQTYQTRPVTLNFFWTTWSWLLILSSRLSSACLTTTVWHLLPWIWRFVESIVSFGERLNSCGVDYYYLHGRIPHTIYSLLVLCRVFSSSGQHLFAETDLLRRESCVFEGRSDCTVLESTVSAHSNGSYISCPRWVFQENPARYTRIIHRVLLLDHLTVGCATPSFYSASQGSLSRWRTLRSVYAFDRTGEWYLSSRRCPGSATWSKGPCHHAEAAVLCLECLTASWILYSNR